jgi:hypothetical protein
VIPLIQQLLGVRTADVTELRKLRMPRPEFDQFAAATRAFNAILQYAFREARTPQVQSVGIGTIPSKARKLSAPIIWPDSAVRFAGRVIPAILDPHDEWQVAALRGPTKDCRNIRETSSAPRRVGKPSGATRARRGGPEINAMQRRCALATWSGPGRGAGRRRAAMRQA